MSAFTLSACGLGLTVLGKKTFGAAGLVSAAPLVTVFVVDVVLVVGLLDDCCGFAGVTPTVASTLAAGGAGVVLLVAGAAPACSADFRRNVGISGMEVGGGAMPPPWPWLMLCTFSIPDFVRFEKQRIEKENYGHGLGGHLFLGGAVFSIRVGFSEMRVDRVEKFATWRKLFVNGQAKNRERYRWIFFTEGNH